ncbi:MAG: DNA repair protein RecN [Polyangiaceae bacterium]
MLVSLAIRNVVLIEQLTMELDEGFNVLTGETGAGKSMLVDALSLVLGGRARPDLVRSGAPSAEVDALFEIDPRSRAAARLEAAGISTSGELVLRRVVLAEGRSRAYVNGRLCTAAQLAEVAGDLCDIASQHESVTLTDPSTHADYLDAFGRLRDARDALAAQVESLQEVARELDATLARQKGRAEREDFLAWQIHEMQDLDPHIGEEVELERERGRLRHAEKLRSATERAADRLYEGDGAICDELARIAADLEQVASIDGSLSPTAHAVDAARAELADAARALGRYAESVETRPERLVEVEERAFRLAKLLSKHGPTTADLLAYRTALLAERESLAGTADAAIALEATKAQRFSEVASAARALSRHRRNAADALADAIGRELALLGMGRARVVVDVAPATGTADAMNVDGARLSKTGIDRVEFLIAPNRGEEPRPLRKIASGGELSRALLALKRVLADQGPAGTYVFDEVDAGVGGAIAEVIGHAIAEIAHHRQVLCITHLPQIAALATTHFVVGKTEARGRTSTHMRRLSDSDRVEEIARMVGGIKVGDAARRAAAELLSARRSVDSKS